MDNFEEPIHHEADDGDVPLGNGADNSITSQVQYFNHQLILKENREKILFVMIGEFSQIHLIYDL